MHIQSLGHIIGVHAHMGPIAIVVSTFCHATSINYYNKCTIDGYCCDRGKTKSFPPRFKTLNNFDLPRPTLSSLNAPKSHPKTACIAVMFNKIHRIMYRKTLFAATEVHRIIVIFYKYESLHESHHVCFIMSKHDDVIKCKHFPRYWPFVRGNNRFPVNSLHKCQWRGALMFSLIGFWMNGWVNNREADDLRRYRAHNDVTVMKYPCWYESRHSYDFVTNSLSWVVIATVRVVCDI